MIEDEIFHSYKDEKGELHKSALKMESEEPQMLSGFPRDGAILLKIANGIGTIGFKLSPDEALRVANQLMNVSRELLNKKRALWRDVDSE